MIEMLKSCRYCGRIHSSGATCEARAADVKRRQGLKKDTEAQRVHSSRHWKSLSLLVRERDGFVCRACWENGIIKNEGLEVHHIAPINEAPEKALEESNCITLCRDCHELAERGEISRQELAALVPGGDAEYPPA